MMVKKDVIYFVKFLNRMSVYFVRLRAQTDIPGETQGVEQEEGEIFYLVMRMMINSLPGIPWHLRFKVKFLYF